MPKKKINKKKAVRSNTRPSKSTSKSHLRAVAPVASNSVSTAATSTTPRLDQLIRTHLYLLIFLIPLFFWPDTLTIFTVPKLLILRTLSISSGIFILLKLFISEKLNLRFSKSWIFLGFWLVSLILSTIFTLNLNTSLFGQYGRYLGIFTMANFLLIPVFIFHFFRPADTRRLIRLSLIASTLAALYGFFQYFNFFDLIKFQFNWTDSPQNRVFGTFGHANHLGGYLAAHAVILIFYPGFNWLKKQNLFWKITYPIVLILHLVTLVLTASRGALLAFIVSLLVAFLSWYFTRPKSPAKPKSNLPKTLIITLTLLALTAGSLYAARDSLADLGLFKRTEATVATIDKGKIPDRLSFLYSALSMFIDHPALGTGLSTFRDSYSAYRRADYYIDGPGNAQYITVPEAAHDEYANILATQGFLGLLAYLLLIIAAIYQIFLHLRQSDDLENRSFNLALLGGLSAYLLQTLFNFGEVNNLFLFYFFLGLIFTSKEVKIKTFVFKSTFAQACKYLFIVAAIFLLVLAFKYGVISEGQADYHLREATLADLAQDNQTAQENFQIAIEARPQEYSIYQNYGDYLLKASATITDANTLKNFYELAIINYQKSIELNPNYPSSFHNLALAYIQMFRLTKDNSYSEQAKKAYQQSVDKAVNNPRYPYEYARKLHSDWNEVPAAIALLKKAIAIDPNYQEPQDYLNFLYKNYPELKKAGS